MNKKKDPPRPRERLVEARNERKLSQKEVADHLGTSDVNVSRWERGITQPTPYFRKKLSRLFGKSEEELDLTQLLPKEGTLPHSEGTTDLGTSSEQVTSKEAVSSIHAIYDSSIPLPPPVDLVGREEELTKLRQGLQVDDSIAIIALHGLPGVGKTTLAITLANEVETRAHFCDGILWAALGPHPDVSSILSRWSLLLGLAAPNMEVDKDREVLTLQLCRGIGTRRMLLVIDDVWKLEDALAFKVGGPHCAYLMTTRFPGIASAFAPRATQIIRELSKSDSMDLLRILAPAVIDREMGKINELAQAVGGLPLALTLLGNYLRLHAYSGQARRIDAALARLSDAKERLHISEPRGPTERHSSLQIDMPISLQSVIDVTVQQLGGQTKASLYALSVFPPKPGSFSEEAALLVANCDVATLDALIDTGLLESAGESRYTLHQTIADHARTALQEDVAPYARLIMYATNLVENHRKEYELLEPEYDSIIAALEAAHTLGKTKELMRCTYAFIPYLRSRGLYEQAEKQLQRAYEGATKLGDDDGKSQALLYLGEIAQKRGNYEQAYTYLLEGLIIARQLANSERISALLADLGWITWKRGEYTRAETYLQEGLALAREIGKSELICDILNTLGSVAASRGEYDTSNAYTEEALALARGIGDREKVCTVLINLGVTAAEQGNDVLAKGYLEEGLVIARQLGHREWICLLLLNLGEISTDQGHNEQAEAHFLECLRLARQIDHIEWTSISLINLGSIAQKQGNYAHAKRYLDEGLNIARQIGRPRITYNALYIYGILFLGLNQIEEAQEKFREALDTIPEGDQELIALTQYGLARIAAAQGNVDQARELGKESFAILESIGHRSAQEVNHWLLSLST